MIAQKNSLAYAYTGNPAQPSGYSAAIKINSLGFLPSAEKKASISTSCSGNFYIKKVSDGSVAYTGTLSAAVFNYDTDENLATANFTSFTTPGLYYVDIPSVGRTQEFVIDSKAYNWAFYMSMKGLYLLRCGTSVSWKNPWQNNTKFSHDSCHPYPEMSYAGPTPARDVTGGHHDANDCDKYVNVASYSCYLLMKANQEFNLSGVKLDIPESNNSVPDVLNEVKYELQSLLKFQDSDGGVYSGTEQNAIAGWRHEMQNRAFRSTACFCATVATAKRVFQEYDASFADQCWNAAVSAYNWLKVNPNWSDSLTAYGDYSNGSVEEKYLWAMCEMWVTADALNLDKKDTYLSNAESRISAFTRGYDNGKIQVLTDYWEPENAGLIDYYFQNSASRNTTLVNTIRDQILTCADVVVNATQGYGRAVALAQNRNMVAYPWGSCPYSTWPNYLLWAANKISPKSSYINAALGNIGFIYGRNYFNQSFQTGVGFKPILRVFKDFEGLCNPTNGYPWPGWVIDGICSFGDKGTTWNTNSSTPWVYIEPAFNYTAYVAYALAMFVDIVDTGGNVPVTNVSVSPTVTFTTGSGTLQLTATVRPPNASSKSVRWSSSNTEVATVNGNGLVTGAGTGTVTITVTTQDGGKMATCSVTVTSIAVTGVTVSPASVFVGVTVSSASVFVGTTTQLTATVSPSNATNKNVSWSSSDTSIATVNSSGLVCGVAAGSATITVTTEDGGKLASITIIVRVSARKSL